MDLSSHDKELHDAVKVTRCFDDMQSDVARACVWQAQ